MNNIQTQQKSGLRARLNEAEACRSMGLLQEAVGVYKRILENPIGIELESQKMIEARLQELEEEMASIIF